MFLKSIRKEQTGSLLFVLIAKDGSSQHLAVEQTTAATSSDLWLRCGANGFFARFYPVPCDAPLGTRCCFGSRSQHRAARRRFRLESLAFARWCICSRCVAWAAYGGAGEDPSLGSRIARRIFTVSGEDLSDPDTFPCLWSTLRARDGGGWPRDSRPISPISTAMEMLFCRLVHAPLRRRCGLVS